MTIFSALRQIDGGTRQQLVPTFTAGLLFWSSMAAQLPVMPLYVRNLGGDTSQVGWVMGAFALGLLLCRSPLGRLSDRKGRRWAIRLGLFVAAVIPLLYAVVPSIPALMVLRALHGISIAAFGTGYSALVADLAPVAQRGEIIGYMSLVNPLGLALGPALGGWVQQVWGYELVFSLASFLAIIGFVVAGDRMTDSPALAPKEWSYPKPTSFWKTLQSDRVRVPATILMLVGLIFGTMSAFMPLLLIERRVSLNPGLFYLAAAIAGFIIRLPVSSWSDRLGRGLFVTVGLSFYALAMVTLSLAHTETTFLLGGVLEGIGAGITIPALMTILTDRTVSEERGFIFGLTWTGFDLGMAIAGPAIGGIASHMGLEVTFPLAFALALTSLTIFVTQANHDLTASWQFALGRSPDDYRYDKKTKLC